MTAVQTWGAVVGLLIGVLTLLGLLVRYGLLPWLQTQLVNPAVAALEEIRHDMRAMARAYDGHLEWSQGEVDRLWDAIEQLRRTR